MRGHLSRAARILFGWPTTATPCLVIIDYSMQMRTGPPLRQASTSLAAELVKMMVPPVPLQCRGLVVTDVDTLSSPCSARALSRLGKKCSIVTDELSEPLLKASLRAASLTEDVSLRIFPMPLSSSSSSESTLPTQAEAAFLRTFWDEVGVRTIAFLRSQRQ